MQQKFDQNKKIEFLIHHPGYNGMVKKTKKPSHATVPLTTLLSYKPHISLTWLIRPARLLVARPRLGCSCVWRWAAPSRGRTGGTCTARPPGRAAAHTLHQNIQSCGSALNPIGSGSNIFVNENPDRFWWSKIAIYLYPGLNKGRPSYRRSLHPSKENI